MFKKTVLWGSVILSSLFFVSCASSERMARMSGGVFGDSKLPAYNRIEGSRQKISSAVIERKTFEMTGKFDDSLINIWPFFYRNVNYFSALWPFMDYDRFGFAIRPFFNKEGNEYSVLFPLTAWNPVKNDGWFLNTYWNRDVIGSVPFFHYNSANGNYYALLYWKNYKKYGIFPFFWAKEANRNGKNGYFNIVPFLFWSDNFKLIGPYFQGKKEYGVFPFLWIKKANSEGKGGFLAVVPLYMQNDKRKFFLPCCYWSDDFKLLTLYYQTKNDIYGFIPFVHFNMNEDGLKYVLPFWKYRKAFGFFPLARFEMEEDSLNYVFPFWKWGDTCGLFPLARFTTEENGLNYVFPFWKWGKEFVFFPIFLEGRNGGYFFPLYAYGNNFFYSPLAGWDNSSDRRVLTILGPMYFRYKTIPSSFPTSTKSIYVGDNTNRKSRAVETKSLFNMYGLLGYSYEKEFMKFKNDAFLGLYQSLKYACDNNGIVQKHAKDTISRYLAKAEKSPEWKRSEGLGRISYIERLPAKVPENREEVDSLKKELVKGTYPVKRKEFGIFPFFSYEKNSGRELELVPLSLEKCSKSYCLFNEVYYKCTLLSGLLSSYEFNGADQYEFSILNPLLFWIKAEKEVIHKQENKSFSCHAGLLYYDKMEVCDEINDKSNPVFANLYEDLVYFDKPRSGVENMFFNVPGNKADPKWHIGFRMKKLGLSDIPQNSKQAEKLAGELRKKLIVKIVKNKNFLIPLYFWKRKNESKELILFPLLSIWKNTPKEQSFLNPFYADLHEKFKDAYPVSKVNLNRNSNSGLSERIRNTVLLGLLYHYRKNTYVMIENKKALNAYDALSRLISTIEYKGIRKQEYDENLEIAKKVLKAFDGTGLSENCTLAELYSIRKSIYERYAKNISVSRRGGMMLYGITHMGNDYEWDILFYLARGKKEGDREQTRILEWLYRRNKEGNRENTLIFPFVSIQKEGNRERCSFLWRLLSFEYKNDKLSSGYIFFIPWGKTASVQQSGRK